MDTVKKPVHHYRLPVVALSPRAQEHQGRERGKSKHSNT
jgi:hypothetical protein